MLRMYCLQQWYGLAGAALEDALYCSRLPKIDPPGVRRISWTTFGGSSCIHTKIAYGPSSSTSSWASAPARRSASWATRRRTYKKGGMRSTRGVWACRLTTELSLGEATRGSDLLVRTALGPAGARPQLYDLPGFGRARRSAGMPCTMRSSPRLAFPEADG